MLSKRSKYALNALVELARAKDEGVLSAQVIADRARVPKKFLEAILVDMRNAGMINSRKGRGGGHGLRRAADKITVAEVLRLFDGAIALVPCVSLMFYGRCEECRDEATCGARDMFLEVRDATLGMLQRATVADLLSREQRLSRRRRQ